MASGEEAQTAGCSDAPRPVSDPPLAGSRAAAAPLFAEMPALAMFTAIVAMGHIQLRRVILPFWVGRGAAVPHWVLASEPLLLATAFFGAAVAHAWCVAGFVREPRFAHIARRGLVGMLAAVVLVSVLIAGILPLPHPSARERLVLMAAGATHFLTVQLAMGAVRFDRSLAGRTTAGLLAGAAVLPLCGLVLRHLGTIVHTPLGHEGVAIAHGLGELCYLLVPIAGAFAVAPWDQEPASVRARRAGAAVVFLCGVVFAAASRMPEGTYGDYLYATLRLEWALERASLGYTVPVSLAVGAATAASASKDPRHRQGGAGLFLWLAGGYNPLSPSRLLMVSLGVALVCRAIVSLTVKPAAERA